MGDVKTNCFAYMNKHRCNALDKINCENCKFFKERTEIRNNPFYPYSYDSYREFEKDLKSKRLIILD